ncbi:MAG: hypothetical protein N3G21_02735 [Candidatus Hydrogenedentes bacterium]|nr:hypothetical protein [Candidatus Hydrogenedentota bacterium]
MAGNSKKTIVIIIFLAFYFCISIGYFSCSTTKEGKKEKVKAGEYMQFTPEPTKVNIQCFGGRYPQIFNPESEAEWITTSSNGMVTIKLVLDSNFPDMSIAYDSVRLRNFDINLLVNENTQFKPVQIIVDKELKETQEGTLIRFRRNIELFFPILASQIMVPKEGLENTSVSLLIRGYDTSFGFIWKPKAIEVETPISMKIGEGKKCISEKIRKTHKSVLSWTHTFD